jgi:alpha-L-arabinofuranosidase
VNAIAPVVTTPDTAVTQPVYYPVLLHAQAALEVAVDTHTDGPAVSPLGPGHHSRWPHRVADLGPFRMVDAAATVSADRRRLALTLVNRNPDQPEPAQIVLRDHAFDGAVRVRTLTAGGERDRPLPGVEGVHLAEGSETPQGQAVTLTLPARSFTVVEAATTSR